MCTNLSCSKLQDMIERNGNSKITIKVVSPAWIVDCIAKKILLSEGPYTILPTESKGNSLTSFFKPAKIGQKRKSNCDETTKPKLKKQKISHSQPNDPKATKNVEDLTSKLFHSQYSTVLSQVPNAQKKTKKYK